MKPDSSLRIFPLPGFAGEEMLWFCEEREREYRTRKTITEPTEQGLFCDTLLLSCYTCFVLVCVLSPLGSNSVGNETDSDHKTPVNSSITLLKEETCFFALQPLVMWRKGKGFLPNKQNIDASMNLHFMSLIKSLCMLMSY